MTIAYRPADERDRRTIADAWVASYRDANSAGCILVDDWYRYMIPTVNRIRERPDVTTTIAYETTDTERIADVYGFIVADVVERPPLVYYVFVKENYRRDGIARGLFAAIGVDPKLPFNYVCSTPWCTTLQRKIPMARWMPRLGRFPKSERRRTA